MRRFATYLSTFAILGALLQACGANASAPSAPSAPSTGTDPLAAYFLTPTLCTDAAGPNCSALRLGDSHLTTSTPAVGKLFSCTPGNASAPGSIRSRITWIDDATGTWNLLKKPWLPGGSFAPAAGTINVSEQAGVRTIAVNNLPVDRRIGNWPMTAYSLLTAIDQNPGVPAARNYSFALPMTPTVAATPTCVGLGAIGVSLNGVVLYDAIDGRGNDALAHEIVDVHGGHPAQTDYHYHFVPERLDATRLADGHSSIIGYIRDGFPIYGYYGVGGTELSNADLDACHGHSHGTLGYHYHATIEYPYTVGCYRGTPR